eukprot:TRINITY_DN5005_c0_g1_i3.p1 TRINITY_DN5005_c0_g1~~TRINITY_DN5005_c0_g1_i3.p1  ORF type:complete len:227 (+),score=31.70 TRINITY_DN5005_c0_g1_i3:355-1035(+)
MKIQFLWFLYAVGWNSLQCAVVSVFHLTLILSDSHFGTETKKQIFVIQIFAIVIPLILSQFAATRSDTSSAWNAEICAVFVTSAAGILATAIPMAKASWVVHQKLRSALSLDKSQIRQDGESSEMRAKRAGLLKLLMVNLVLADIGCAIVNLLFAIFQFESFPIVVLTSVVNGPLTGAAALLAATTMLLLRPQVTSANPSSKAQTRPEVAVAGPDQTPVMESRQLT